MKLSSHKQRCCPILDVNTDQLAGQLTLIDLAMFKAIKRDELLYLDRSAHKQNLAPNVVAMNKQFNQVTFWVVGQILSQDSAKTRADLIAYFTRTAKALNQLNNLHSSYAIISALLSLPIYRLTKTWNVVKKKHQKEKQLLDQMLDLYSDSNNYEMLRIHLAHCQLPCIPYLGIFFRDIIHVSEAYQDAALRRTKSTCKILDSIERFQTSHYDHLVSSPRVQLCFLSRRYIDELQKFVEDENYRRSLELEPQQHHQLVDINTSQADQSTVGHISSPTTPEYSRHLPKRSAMLLASLTSILHSAVITTSNRFSATSASSHDRKLGDEARKVPKYLIDDSCSSNSATTILYQTNLPPPISTSN